MQNSWTFGTSLSLSLFWVHFNVIRNVCMPNQEQTEKAARRKSDKQQCHFIVKQLMRCRWCWLLLLQHIFCMCPFAHTIAELKYKGKRKIKEIKRRDTEFGSSFMSSSLYLRLRVSKCLSVSVSVIKKVNEKRDKRKTITSATETAIALTCKHMSELHFRHPQKENMHSHCAMCAFINKNVVT